MKKKDKFIGYCLQISDFREDRNCLLMVDEIFMDEELELDFSRYITNSSYGVGYYGRYMNKNGIVKRPISYYLYNGRKYEKDGKYFCELENSDSILINELDTTIEDINMFISLLKDYGNVYDNLICNFGSMVEVKVLDNKEKKVKRVYGKLTDVGTIDISVDNKDIYFNNIYSIMGKDIHYVNPFVGFDKGISFDKYFDSLEKIAKNKKDILVLKREL